MLDSEAGSVVSMSTGSFGFGFERFIGFCQRSVDGRKALRSPKKARRRVCQVATEHDAPTRWVKKAE